MKPPPRKVVQPRAADGTLYPCPCCRQRTLEQRGANEICHLCYWQDEGQDDPVADEVWGGANGRLSLTQARENFRQCGAYDPRIGHGPAEGTKDKTKPEEQVGSGLSLEELRKRRKARPKSPAPAAKAVAASEEDKKEASYSELLDSLPPPPPPPAPPKAPSVWTQPLSNAQVVRAGLGLVLLLVLALLLHGFTSGWLTGQMLKDHGYYLWAHGRARYEPKYLDAFAHDPLFRQRFLGQPVDALHPLFPRLWGGAPSDPEYLRAFNPGHAFPAKTPGARFSAYWLDSWWGDGKTYCALLKDGIIVDFFFVDRR